MDYRALLVCCVFLLSACASTSTTPDPSASEPAAVASFKDCAPGAPCAAPYKVKMVVVTMFEIGEDEGDAPGEFQLWKARRGLTTRIPFPHGHHDLYLNEETGVLGIVTGIGTLHSASAIMALGLDHRFDLTDAYWLVAGIAGIDPEDASIGSVAWSAHLVDGDLMHQIDVREVPQDWPFGHFARHTKYPFDPKRRASVGEHYLINESLRDWAYELTKDAPLADPPGLAETRNRFTEHPNARKPPFVLKGGHIAAMTFWHGAKLNDWANRYVHYWSDGATDFVTSAMEETGSYQSMVYLDRLGKVDKDRFMVLRGGSNYTMPPPGVSAVDHLLGENTGYAGLEAALESIYTVGSIVIDELLGQWPRYKDEVPGT